MLGAVARRLFGSATSSAVFTSRSVSPCELTLIIDRSIPAATRRLRIVFARLSPSWKLTAGVPVVSVCPTAATSGTGRFLTACRISGSCARLWSVSSSDSKRKNKVKCCAAGGVADYELALC